MGTLFLVSTPIGNLGDITLRALETLKGVSYILCEDTRITGRLLKRYDITGKMVSFNDFNEDLKTGEVIDDLVAGGNIALVSDAGTPLISDPGYKLVREAIENDVKVEVIPGPSALVAGLTISGKPPDKFIFLGYLPKKEGKRKGLLQNVLSLVSGIKLTVVIYESPYRVLKTLKDFKEIFGDIDIVVCRELTKLHEEVRRGKVSELIIHFSKVIPKGEFTIIL